MPATYSFRLTAEGWAQFSEDMKRLAAESETAARAYERLRAASPSFVSAMERAEQVTQRTTQALTQQAGAAAETSRTIGGVGQAAAAAGPQLQDLIVQLQMGTNVFQAIGQQGSQFLSIFGPGGAMAGAALAVGALAAQFLLGRDSADALNGAIEQQEKLYEAATKAADQYMEGIQKQAREIAALTARYASLNEEEREFERRRLERSREDLDTQRANVVRDALSAIEQPSRAVNAFIMQFRRQGQEPPAEAMAMATALAEFRARAPEALAAGEPLAPLFMRIAAAAVEASRGVSAAAVAGDQVMGSIDKLIPAAQRLDQQFASNQRQVGALAGEVDRTSASLTEMQRRVASLQQLLLANPFSGIDASIAKVREQIDALNRGGLPALERVRDQQREAGDATRYAREEAEKYRRQLEALGTMNADQIAEKLQAEQAGFLQRGMERAALEAQLRRQEEEAEERRKRAERAAREAETRARQALRRDERADRREIEEGVRLAERAAPAMEKYAEQVRLLDRALAAGKITQEQYNRAVSELNPATEEARKAFEKARREAEQFERQSRDALTRIGETALDRIGQGLVTAFLSGEKAALNFGNLARSVLASVASDLIKLAIVNPAVNSIFPGTPRPTLDAALGSGGGGGSSLLSLSNLGSIGSLASRGWSLFEGGATGLANSLNPGTWSVFQGTGVGSFLNTPLWTTGVEMYGPFSAAAPTTPFFADVTLGGLLGATGLGFGAGTLLNSLLGGNRLGGTIGSGLGTAAGIGAAALAGLSLGPLGLIGGALGGALGGLFGPKVQHEGSAVRVGIGPDGTLQVLGFGGKWRDAAADAASVQQQLNAIQQQFAQRGLRFSTEFNGAGNQWWGPGNMLTEIGFGKYGQTTIPLDQALYNARGLLRSDNANVMRVLQVPTGSMEATLSHIDWVRQVYEPAVRAAKGVDELQQALDALYNQFAPLIERAQFLGLATEDLSKAWSDAEAEARRTWAEAQKAKRDAEEMSRLQQEGTILGLVRQQQSVLTGFLDSLAYGGAGLASPQDRLTAAQSAFGDAMSRARAAGLRSADLSAVVSAGQAVLAAGRDLYATGPQAAALESMVRSSVSSLGAQLDLPAFGGALDRAVDALRPMPDALDELRREVAALREELRTARLRAAA